jgi:protein phosphatase PTC2/3
MKSDAKVTKIFKPSNNTYLKIASSLEFTVRESKDTTKKSKDFNTINYQSRPLSVQNDIKKFSSVNFGHLKFYGVENTSSAGHYRNKIRIILSVPKPCNARAENWPPSSFFGMYTGHFGSSCSSFLKENLHKYIFEDTNFPVRPKQAIINGFNRADAEYMKQANDNCDISGSFAVVVMIIGNKCYIANTGNDKAILSYDNKASYKKVTQDHDISNIQEKVRIESIGGTTYQDFIIDVKGNKVETGPFKVFPTKTNFTRSFGDMDKKSAKYGGYPGIIICEPYVKSFKIKDSYDFILLCSENIFEISNNNIIHYIWTQINKGKVGIDEYNVFNGLEAFTSKAQKHSIVLIGLKNLTETKENKNAI